MLLARNRATDLVARASSMISMLVEAGGSYGSVVRSIRQLDVLTAYGAFVHRLGRQLNDLACLTSSQKKIP